MLYEVITGVVSGSHAVVIPSDTICDAVEQYVIGKEKDGDFDIEVSVPIV